MATAKMNTKSRQPLSVGLTLNRHSGLENACMILNFVGGTWEVPEKLSGSALPESVYGIIAQRI